MIYYIHGFNSGISPDNPKPELLRQIGSVTCLEYDSFGTYASIFDELSNQIDMQNPDTVLVGTSLGGFWAATLADKCGFSSVIINPAVDPGSSLTQYLGQELTNYSTGAKRTLTEKAVSSYKNNSFEFLEFEEYLPLLLLDENDELLSSANTLQLLDWMPHYMFPGGCHQFAHMEEALEHIRIYLNSCELKGYSFDD